MSFEDEKQGHGGGYSRWVIVFLVLLVAGLGLLARLYLLETESIWFDEVVSVEELGQPSLGAYLTAVREDDPPMSPFYFVLQYGWARAFGADPWQIRLLSILFGTLTIPVVYLLGRHMFGSLSGLIAAALTALSLPQILYSQEARVYSLVTFLTAVSMYALVRGLAERRRSWWVLHGTANALIAATHALSLAVFVPQGLFLLLIAWRNKRLLLIWFASMGLLVLAEAAWMLSNLGATLVAAAYIEPPGIPEFLNAFLVLAGGRPTNWDPTPYTHTGLSLGYPMAALMSLLALWLLWRGWRDRPKEQGQVGTGPSAVLLMLWLFAPGATLYIVSYLLHPAFIFRYFVYSSLAFTLLAGGGIAMLPGKWLRSAAACMLLGLAAYQTVIMPRPFRPDYQQVVSIINEHETDDDPIIVFKHVNAKPFRFVSGYDPSRIYEMDGIQDLRQRLVGLSAEHPCAWVVTWHWDRLDELEAWMIEQGFTFKSFETGGIPPVYLHWVGFPKPDR